LYAAELVWHERDNHFEGIHDALPMSESKDWLSKFTPSNRSSSFFTTAAPSPVYVSYKWLDPQTGSVPRRPARLSPWLPRTVFPNESVDVIARIIAR
jgi:hypothetical protein